MPSWWNWYTRTFQVRMSQDVGVRVPSTANTHSYSTYICQKQQDFFYNRNDRR